MHQCISVHFSALGHISKANDVKSPHTPGVGGGEGFQFVWWQHNTLILFFIFFQQDPYFMKNHLGSYECKLCLTLHNNEVKLD